jgi:hypothetical protein
MKKSMILASAAMTMIIAGCTSEDYEPVKSALPESSNQVTLTVSAVTKNPDVTSDLETRVAYESTDATWEEGDKIFLIKSDGTTITLTLSDGAGTSEGSFTSTDAITAGSYTPYAVSASSLTKEYVKVTDGVITLDLSTGGGTLNEALEHDVLKGDVVTLEDGQTEAEIEGLTTHILSYIRFRFTSESKAITSIGMNSTGGVYQTVTIASDGSVSGSDSSTDVIYAAASDDDDTYAGYFAVYGSTNTSLLAHAEDADGGKYSRLVSTKEATYTAGTVYGKTFTLSEDMVTADASGTLSDQTWKNLGLSVKWSEYYVYTSEEFAYNRSFDTNGNTDPPASWSGWRLPTREEVNELYYASTLEWISSDTGPNGMKFNCNGNYIAMGASGYYYDWEVGDRVSQEGESIYFFIDEKEGDNRLWTKITNSDFSIYNAGSRCTNVRCFTYFGAMRLVCDY